VLPANGDGGSDPMTIETAKEIHDGILASVQGDPALEQAARSLVQAAVRYARIRADWQMATLEERKGMDGSRTAAHNALIDACNIVSRKAVKKGRTAAWRGLLGQDRKEIGDFACHLHCLLGILAR
jgi:hypothetical protein